MKYVSMNENQGLVDREERIHMMRESIAPHGPGHGQPIPPHERRNMLYVEFNEKCEEILREMLGSEEEAEVAINILHCAPPEQQIIALQILRMYGVKLKTRFPETHVQAMNARWGSPVLGQEVNELYVNTYGEEGEHYVEVLESSPYEIAVISRMIAHMQEKKGE